MKSKLINNIQNGMKPYLNSKQQNLLFKTLLDCFEEVKHIELNKFDDENFEEHNVKLLNLFLSAKQVEGCSKKTVNYYKSTILFMMKRLNKDILSVSTDDLREFLSNHRKERNSSKVTFLTSRIPSAPKYFSNVALFGVSTYRRTISLLLHPIKS